MIKTFNNLLFYARTNNILIAVMSDFKEVPLLKFKQNFVDLPKLDSQMLQYMNDYIEMWPNLIELFSDELEVNQLSLF